METARAALTVLFEPPFWVGVFERESGGRYEACRVVFGAEPRDFEVYAYVLDRYHRLTFSPALPAGRGEDRPVSPKRLQRQARAGGAGGGGPAPPPAAPGQAEGEAPGAVGRTANALPLRETALERTPSPAGGAHLFGAPEKRRRRIGPPYRRPRRSIFSPALSERRRSSPAAGHRKS